MRLGAFRLKKPIGEGGMGTVWLGKHVDTEIEVAVKVMLPDVIDDPEYRQAFATEVRAVAGLNHPNIVTILDFGEIPQRVADQCDERFATGSPYLVTEFAQGGSVEDYMADVEWPDVRELALVVLDALSHAHARDVIHRDLKPENILVGCGSDWRLALTDFGLAHATDRFDKSGRVEDPWGTPEYMAPEQFRGLWRKYGPWTDLYALGCMVYEIVCGRWPYEGDSVVDIARAHIDAPIPELEPRFAVPKGAEEWVQRLLAKQRGRRFGTAADAARALGQLPALDEDHDFGVLFVPPESDGELRRRSTQPVVATQILSEDATEELAPRDRAGDDPDRTLEDIGVRAPIADESDEIPPFPLDWRRDTEEVMSDELLGISLGLFGLRAVPVVDREQERDWLWKRLGRVRAGGESHQIVLEGPRGTGKSTLVRWLCRRAREVGTARVMRAHHSPVSGPADGLEAMLERFLRSKRLSRDEIEEHIVEFLVAEGLVGAYDPKPLYALLGARRSGDDAPQRRRGESDRIDRQKRYATMYRFLCGIADERPLIVWLDDVQWGPDSLRFARYVARHSSEHSAPIVVVMTVDTDLLVRSRSAKDQLDRLTASGGVETRQIGALDDDSIEELVHRMLRLHETMAGYVVDRSGGVPLFAVQLVEDWVARRKLTMGDGGFELRDGVDVSIPDDLHQLLDDRIRGFLSVFGPEGVGNLELAAALGNEVDFQEWDRARMEAELPRRDGLVDRLVDEDLAEPIEGGWRFAHAMLRESLERRAIEQGRWKRWNDCCARALEALYGGGQAGIFERIAWHRIVADQPGRALEPLTEGIDAAIESSEYDRARELIEWRDSTADGTDARWPIQGEIDLARIEARRGNFLECTEQAGEALDAAEAIGCSNRVAWAELWYGVGCRGLGELDRSEELLDAAHRHFDDEDRRGKAQALLELGRVHERRGDFEMARQHFERARELSATLGDIYGEALCFNGIGDVMRRSGQFERAEKACRAALKRFRQLDNVTGIADCLNDLAEGCRLQGKYDEARHHADEALRLYRTIDAGQRHFVRLNLAMIDLEEGRCRIAAGLFRDLVDAFDRRGEDALEAAARAGMLAADASMEDWEDWDCQFEALQDLSERTGARLTIVARALSRASRLAEKAGEPERAGRAEELGRQLSGAIRETVSEL